MQPFFKLIAVAEVPELEDMSEELERVKALRSHKHKSGKPPQQHTSHTTSDVDSVSRQHQKAKSVLHTKPKLKDSVDSNTSFGGFKKGFLFPSSDSKSRVRGAPVSQKTSSPPTTTRAQTKSDDIPFIKPKDKEKSSLEFPEVQQAMKESFPLLQSQGKRNIVHAASYTNYLITFQLQLCRLGHR